MKTGGIDIGSRFIKYVMLEDGRVILFRKAETGVEPLSVCRRYIEETAPDRLIATGYGRHLMEVHGDYQAVTEIKAVARGARHMFPECRTIIDIGGQDTKAVSLNEKGSVAAFEMNDRCAAGTGKFLEVMSHALGYEVEHFGEACTDSAASLKINSMCTVFAESEVIGLISRGIERASIAAALHTSVIDKVIPLVERVGVADRIVFAGGCARNACLVKLLQQRVKREILVNENPDMLAALGAALLAGED